MSMQFVHPSRSKLRDWLSALAPSERITVHVEACERCATRLIDIADLEVSDHRAGDGGPMPGAQLLVHAVTTEWTPPTDLAERVIRVIDEREHNQRDLSVVLGLLGVATETASLMMPPEQRPNQANDLRRENS